MICNKRLPMTDQDTSSLTEDRTPPPRRRGLIAGSALALTALLLAALFFAATHGRFGPAGAAPAPAPTPPEGWQTYHDPQGLFTVSLPQGWTAQVEVGEGHEGDLTGSVTFKDYNYAFGAPPVGTNSITVGVYVVPVVNDFMRRWNCQNWQNTPNNTTIAGLPAWDMGNGSWLLDTNTAHFQISYRYPKDRSGLMQRPDDPTATPMPPGFYERGQQEIKTIVASFTPTPATPLVCK
jgi:hypothetical protein